VFARDLEATGWAQESLPFLDAAVPPVARARRGVPVHCSAGIKSLPDTLRIAGSSMTSL